MDGVTRDDILYGQLKLWQPLEGPRVSMDTVLLAAWARRGGRRFVELGAASGAVSLILARRFPPPFQVVGVELQPRLTELARRNREENGLEDRVTFLQGDFRDPALLPPESFDGLVVNPPYESPGRGRLSPVASRSIARQGGYADDGDTVGTCSIEDVAGAAARLLRGRGRFFAVFRADRMVPFLTALSNRRLSPKRLRMVHPGHERPANLFLVEALKGGKEGVNVEPPLVVLDDGGQYTPDLLRAYTLEGLPPP